MTDPYVSLDLLKEALKISDAGRDNLLTQALDAACRGIDQHCGRRFYPDTAATTRTYSTRDRVITRDDLDELLVDDIATTTDLAVETGTTGAYTALDLADLDYGPDNAVARGHAITGILATKGGWPSRYRVRVTARWGWPTVPDEVAQAALIQAARLYRRKDSPEGVVGSSEWGVVRVTRLDPDVQALLQPYVVPVVG